MKETPPYSLAEIQILLSQYLDGVLEAEQMVEIDTLLEKFPHYRKEFLKLQATHGAIQETLERQTERQLQFTKISDGVWKNIAARLEADKESQLMAADPEFVSAYYDGEILATDPERQTFESQLYNNPEANRLLAELGQVSDMVRQFGYWLEEACTLDIAGQVMQAFMSEQGMVPASQAERIDEGVISSVLLPDGDAEILSAYVDQELSARETIEANRLIETNASARLMFGRFNQLSEQIQIVSQQLQARVPDFWPAIAEILQKSPDQGGIVIPIDQNKRIKNVLRIVIPSAAAALLILFSMPAMNLQQGSQSAPQIAASVAMDAPSAKGQAEEIQLASVPVASMGQQRANFMPAADSAADYVPVMETRMREPVSQPLQPVLAPAPKIAASPQAAPARSAEGSEVRGKGKAPSSEEYLFQALNEQMPNEDISAILGK